MIAVVLGVGVVTLTDLQILNGFVGLKADLQLLEEICRPEDRPTIYGPEDRPTKNNLHKQSTI